MLSYAKDVLLGMRPGHVRSTLRDGWSRLLQDLRRAVRHRGHERETLLQLLKSALAALIAWMIASPVLHSDTATFAPFSALLVVQATVYRSLLQSWRYIVAVLVGVLLAGAFGLAFGLHVWSFALALVGALVVGRWRWLGTQGVQLPVVVAFALGGGIATDVAPSVGLFLMTLLGAGVGVLLNAVLAPPMRFRGAANAVHDLSVGICELLSDMASGLHKGWPTESAGSWMDYAHRFDGTLENARAAVEQDEETLYLNPRRLLRAVPRALPGYRAAVSTLSRVLGHVHSIARTLDRAVSDQDRQPDPQESFLAAYGKLLASVAEAARYFGQQEKGDGQLEEPELFAEHLDEAGQEYDKLTRQIESQGLNEPDKWPSYGALLVDAQRLLEEFRSAHSQAVIPAEDE